MEYFDVEGRDDFTGVSVMMATNMERQNDKKQEAVSFERTYMSTVRVQQVGETGQLSV